MTAYSRHGDRSLIDSPTSAATTATGASSTSTSSNKAIGRGYHMPAAHLQKL